jgi:ribonuclease VapC
MIVDTSALLAILLSEAEARQYSTAISLDRVRLLSTASYVEAGLKLTALGIDAIARLDRALTFLDLRLVDVTPEHAREAVRARRIYGRAPARLNFGDCIVYGLAKTTGEPLLFKGDDFTHTDVARVL